MKCTALATRGESNAFTFPHPGQFSTASCSGCSSDRPDRMCPL